MTDLDSKAPLVDRRTVAKGAAWAAPALAAVAVVPVASASPQPHNALAGVFQLRRHFDGSVTIDGRSWGGGDLYVAGTTDKQTITSISINFGSTYPMSGFTREGGDGTWTLPMYTGTMVYEGRTFYMYTSNYTGTMPTCVNGDTDVDSEFYWELSVHNPATMIAQRVVTITQPPSYSPPGQTVKWIRNVAAI